jgi:hypothetical protein
VPPPESCRRHCRAGSAAAADAGEVSHAFFADAILEARELGSFSSARPGFLVLLGQLVEQTGEGGVLHGLQVWAPPVRAALPAMMHRPVEKAGVIDTGLASPSSSRGVWSATATARFQPEHPLLPDSKVAW